MTTPGNRDIAVIIPKKPKTDANLNGIAHRHTEEARQILESVHGKSLSVEERCQTAIRLAGLLLDASNASRTRSERRLQAQLSRMIGDRSGKTFTTAMTDSSFRSTQPRRVADQIIYLIKHYGIPRYLRPFDRWKLRLFKWFGNWLPHLLVPLTTHMLRREMAGVMLQGEYTALKRHMRKRRKEGIRINLNRLGEAILGEEEALHRLALYLDDLAQPDIEYISIKISTICSQLHLLAWDHTLEILAERLRELYRAASAHSFERPDGTSVPKFVNLDMEEYRDLHLTVDLFKKVLSEPEFLEHSAGIVLQAYLPDSFPIQQELTQWAIERRKKGGNSVKIRIVKGANLAMEQVEASLHGWPQAPYTTKLEVDANYKRMVTYGCHPDRADAVHLGVASHNLFDIAYALLLRAENQVEKEVNFEMLEGMADHMRRVVQDLTGNILLYCPAARKEEFQNAVAYLVRRLDENTGPENFLGHSFDLKRNSPEWVDQVKRFMASCSSMERISSLPRRTQDRNRPPEHLPVESPFRNEPDTDFALPPNREWADSILRTWRQREAATIPLVIGGHEVVRKRPQGEGFDPSENRVAYTYALANEVDIETILETAHQAAPAWASRHVQERSHILAEVARQFRNHRGELIGAMVLDGGKRIQEGDPEVSEAIDFLEYYRRRAEELEAIPDIRWRPKGTVLVTPPWNFPCAIPTSAVAAALAAGNTVILKPAPEAVMVGYEVAKLFWLGGVPKEVLQFVNCVDDPIGTLLIRDPRVDAVALTGGTATARLFCRLRPGLDLMAETGGKNAIIVSDLADRDLAVKAIVQSAFGHAGQKCSAASVVILHREVYDDPRFLRQLRDAVASLEVGSTWNTSSTMTPLIRPPSDPLAAGLTRLEEGESWLLEPHADADNPNLWSPGIKLGTKPGSYSHQTEFFGPLLSLIRANDLNEALQIANDTAYGLTSGIQSLDEREIDLWLQQMEAGNLYVNRGITGAIVLRQPFGGCKASSFGLGAKAGGPNYVSEFMHAEQIGDPLDRLTPEIKLEPLRSRLAEVDPVGMRLFDISVGNYAFWWDQLREERDSVCLIGQDNYLRYVPRANMKFRVEAMDAPVDVARVLAAAAICGATLEISWEPNATSRSLATEWPYAHHVEEEESDFIKRLEGEDQPRIRMVGTPSRGLVDAVGSVAGHIEQEPVLANGRLELLHYLREVAISHDYHRYGNLGLREIESRTPLPI